MALRVQTIRIVECLNTSSEAFEVLKAAGESAEKENIFFAFLFDYWPIAKKKNKNLTYWYSLEHGSWVILIS